MPTTSDLESQRMLLGTTPVRKIYQGPNLIGARIAELFANGEQGVWYDPSDLSTLFQDAAGTLPVTSVEQPVGRMLDKSGRGNHASQTTTTARPILSARYNLLSNTVFAGAVSGTDSTSVQPTGWSKVFWAGGSIDVDNSADDGAITFSTTLGRMVIGYQFPVTAGQVYVCSADVEVLSGSYNAVSVIDFTGAGTGAVKKYFFNGVPIDSGHILSSGRLVCVVTVGTGVSTTTFRLGSGADSSRTGVIKISRPDVRLSVDSSSLPDYQRVVSPSEYSTEGFPYYLRFDGVDDHLNIGVLNMSAASAAGYFSAITKLSDASSGRWYSHELATAVGSVRLLAPANNGQASVRAGFVSSSGLREIGGQSHAAPITLTVRSEIEPGVRIWVTHNNVAAPSRTVVPTVFSADGVACIGAQVYVNYRANFFNGRIYALLVAGRKSSGSELAVIETFLRNKSRAY